MPLHRWWLLVTKYQLNSIPTSTEDCKVSERFLPNHPLNVSFYLNQINPIFVSMHRVKNIFHWFIKTDLDSNFIDKL